MCSCTAVPLLFHVVLATLETYHRTTLSFSCWYQSFSFAISHCHKWQYITVFFMALRRDFAPALETVDNRSAPDRGCMRDVPGFLQLRNYTTCVIIFWPVPVHNLALVLCIPIRVRFSEIETSNSDIWRSLWSRVLSRALFISADSARVTFFFYHSAISDLKWLEKTL